MTWHLDPEALARYGTGLASGAEAASAEAHLLRCETCRTAVAGYADTTRLDLVLANVTDALDRPRVGPVERLLRAVGVPDGTARVLVATPALRVSWLLSVLAVLAFAVVAARSDGDADPFLVLAPVLPVIGVAIAYGRGTDPTFEIAVAAPFSGLRLVLLRAGSVLAATVLFAGLSALLLPDSGAVAAWLLPALALTVATLALGTTWDPVRAASLVGGTWVIGTTYALRRDLDVGGASTQFGCLLLLAGAAIVVAVRRDRYEIGVDS